MKRETSDEPDPEPANKRKTTGVEGQSPPGKQGQLCVVENDDQRCSRQQLELPSSSKQQNTRFINDREQLLRILPEELWLDVFAKLDSSDDLEAVSNSSPFFRQLLLPERVNFLFKNVWQIVGGRYVNSPTTAGLSRRWRYFSSPTAAADRALRSVCRSWNQDIDKLNETRELKILWKWDNGRTLPTLLSHFDATHGSATTRSPFLGKSIAIVVLEGEDDVNAGNALEHFDNNLLRLLDKYGQHFWHCRIFEVHTCRASTSLKWRISPFMQRMPNLKTLEIHFKKASLEWEELDTEINVNLLPALNGLEELTLAAVAASSIPLPILRKLISINGSVSTSSASSATLAGQLNGPLVSRLKSLSIRFCAQNCFEMITSDQFDWHLSKLELDLRECASIDWQSVFNALGNKFGRSLTELRLLLPGIKNKQAWERVSEESKTYTLDLPHLTNLKLTLVLGNLPCLDFLLPMKNSLQVLILSTPDFYRGKASQAWMRQVECIDAGVLKIWSCLKCPLRSNIWTEFPKMEKFEFWDNACVRSGADDVDFFVHTRRQWKKEMNNSKGSTLAI